jgi:hypothetical protein
MIRRIIYVGTLIDLALIFERDKETGDVDEEVIRELELLVTKKAAKM